MFSNILVGCGNDDITDKNSDIPTKTALSETGSKTEKINSDLRKDVSEKPKILNSKGSLSDNIDCESLSKKKDFSCINNKKSRKISDEFSSLDKKQILDYDCSKLKKDFISTAGIDIEKACHSRKASITLKDINIEDVFKFDCNSSFNNSEEISICKGIKVSKTIGKFIKDNNILTDFDCSIFKGDEITICEKYKKRTKK
ncbi:MAG: hypothetical protein PHS92_02735 [Candidatus Gracilibacteria bacterium]|nr:hypothetical protein [Candidatus Gracilibacteria bacterium]